jgi:type I restriction enzyme, R subunit
MACSPPSASFTKRTERCGADGREHLCELLNRASGGVVFTTIHKFMPEKGEAMPELSARQNIVVIADEAHRSQYGFGGKEKEKTGEMSYGFTSNLRDALPNASFIGCKHLSKPDSAVSSLPTG